MASKKTPAAKKRAKTVVARAAAAKTAASTVPAATGAAAAVQPVAASPIGSPDAVCANLAALRTALAGEKAREGAAERKKIVKDLEVLELDYREAKRSP